MTNAKVKDMVTAATGAAAALLIEHVALWEKPQRIEHPAARYTIGVATLNTAMTWYLLRHKQYDAAAALWCVAGVGGATVATCYYIREITAAIQKRGHYTGQVIRLIDDAINQI